MTVSAVIVTRGDVDLAPVEQSIPKEWQLLVYDNGQGQVRSFERGGFKGGLTWMRTNLPDLSVYGRYAAIEHAFGDVIYVQDDDVIVSDPQAIVDVMTPVGDLSKRNFVVCNMPPEFRHDFYRDHALVGFGAAFHRGAPDIAFSKFALSSHANGCIAWGAEGVDQGFFDRTCDIVFTGLTPRVLVDVPKQDLSHAHAENRMWKQREHVAERTRMLELVRQVATA